MTRGETLEEEVYVTTLRLHPEDQKALKIIRRRWGLESNSAAQRLALRILARSRLEITGLIPITEVEDGEQETDED